jgi:catechol 2,3-dioxygenase-like lactoylglutathione lyase family enzyme
VRGATKTKIGELNRTVNVGGTDIAPGDIVVLDADGGVRVKRGRIEKCSKPLRNAWRRKMLCAKNCWRGKYPMTCTVCVIMWKGAKVTDQNEPIHDIAHLGHVELLTPRPDESLRFFVEVMGMIESGRKGDSVYLRGWDDYEYHSLQLTASKTSGLGHFAFRAMSPQALQRRVETIEQTGLGKGWKEDSVGHGPAYCCTTPDGHNMEIYYETEWYQAPAALKPALKNQCIPIF